MSDLRELAENFAKHTECKLDMLDNGYGCTISLGQIELRIMHQPGSEILVFQLPVGILPENPEQKKFSELVFRLLNEGIVWMKKLEANELESTLSQNSDQTLTEDNLKNTQWLSL